MVFSRYSAPSLPPPPSCNHTATEVYQCREVSMQDVRRMHQKFYSNPNREAQQNFILHHVTVHKPERERSRNNDGSDYRRKQISIKYFIPVLRGHNETEQVQICKKLFISTLCVGRDRVQALCRKFLKTGDVPKDQRGRDTRSQHYSDKKQSVKTFIESLQVLEKHYCRGQNITRQYLPSELNITKLWKQYNETHEENLHVEYDYFRNIFDNFYNISFGSPATDVCSTCLSLGEEIKNCRDPQKKKL